MTWRAARNGRRWARATTWRISAMETEAPLRRTIWRSGSVPARAARHVAHSPHPPSGHSSAAAKPSAADLAPVAGRPAEKVCVHRIGRRRGQRVDRLVLADHAGEERAAGRSSLTGPSARRRTLHARKPRYGPPDPGQTPRRPPPASARDRPPPGRGTLRARGRRTPGQALHPVQPFRAAEPGSEPSGRNLDRDVDEDRQIRSQAVGRPLDQRAQRRWGRAHAHSPGMRPSSPRSGRLQPTHRRPMRAPAPAPRAQLGPPPSRVPRPAVTRRGRRVPGAARAAGPRARWRPVHASGGRPAHRPGARAWVDLPQPSMPSSAIRRPLATISEGFARSCLHRRDPSPQRRRCPRPSSLPPPSSQPFPSSPSSSSSSWSSSSPPSSPSSWRPSWRAGPLLARRRAGGAALGQELGRPVHVDRLDRVTLAQTGIGRAVGDVGAEPSVLDDDGQVGGGIRAELAQRCRGGASAALLGLGEQRPRLVQRHRQELVLAREAPRVGPSLEVRTEAAVVRDDLLACLRVGADRPRDAEQVERLLERKRRRVHGGEQ